MLSSCKRFKIISAALAAITALLGDALLGKQDSHLAKALVDNATHALIACFTWMSVLSASENVKAGFFPQIIFCGVLASLIDADHFIAAGSWSLSDATSLPFRPFLHCTALIIFAAGTLISIGWMLSMQWVFTVGWIIAAAGVSHHVRDGTRRGLWIWSDISTSRIPYKVYIVSIFSFPLCLSYVIQNWFIFPKKVVPQLDV